ncbi:alpha/beta hydrolase family protein [Mongoliimonas terrestris]|uniref:alpha/beta hydrolase family protein n=1 Tax=Mongoliimonas terrestris TaxID=1709001 RepID=UPI0009499269|nr:alpha/beta hydrolase [Mongoliimonas terrestris]
MHEAGPVGFTTRAWVDPDRTTWDGTPPRPLAAAVWYPAPAGTTVADFDIGPPGRPFCRMGKVAVDAPLAIAPGGRPVVLLSHGTGGTAAGFGWLGIRLAERGYLAVGVDHHGNTANEPYRAEGFMAWWERARDLSVALDRLAADPLFGPAADLGRVFAAGFSLGGYTVLALAGAITEVARFDAYAAAVGLAGVPEFPDLIARAASLRETSPAYRDSLARHGESHRDERVRAVFAIAPAPTVRGFTDESLAALRVPVDMLVGDADTIAPADDCARWLAARLPDARLTVTGLGVGHYVYLPEGLPVGKLFDATLFADPPGIDRRRLHDEAADLALRVFARSGGIPVTS